MLVPVLSTSPAYYFLAPILFLLFIAIFYVFSSYLSIYFMKKFLKAPVIDFEDMVSSGFLAFLFASPFVYAFADNFSFLFFITTRSLLLFSIFSFIFQYLYSFSSLDRVDLRPKNIVIHLIISTTIGYWAICLMLFLITFFYVIIN